MKLDPAKLADPLALTVGQTGAAHAGLMLANVLAAAKPGDRILVAVAADGADAIVLRVTDAAARFAQPRSVGRMIESKGDVGYGSYLKWREILPTEPPRRPDPDRPAGPPMLRARRGSSASSARAARRAARRSSRRSACACRCRRGRPDGAYAFRRPPRAHRDLTLDRLAFSLNPPTVSVVLDFDGGGRFLCEMTDCEPEKVAIGDEVEMTFRRMFAADGSATISGRRARGAELEETRTWRATASRIASPSSAWAARKFGEHWDKGADDLLIDAAYDAYASAGIDPNEVDAYWLGTMGQLSGLTLSVPLKIPYKPVTHVENFCATGSESLRQACYAVASGAYDVAMAIGVEKLKDSGYSGLVGSEPPNDGTLV